MSEHEDAARVDGMEYPQWLDSHGGCGQFLVSWARQALDKVIERENGHKDSAGQDIGACRSRFDDIYRQCSRWRALAAMENLFRAYPGIVETVGAMIQAPIDGMGEARLMVNNDHYEPGDINEFDPDMMEELEDMDGLVAINWAYDSLLLACSDEHPGQEADCLMELSEPRTQAQVQALMAREAPELDAAVQQLWMRQATKPARKAGTRPARI